MRDLTLKTERPWHSEPATVALELCRSSAQGLSSDEAARRLEADGPNRLPAGKTRSLFARVFSETWTVDQGKLIRLKARRG